MRSALPSQIVTQQGTEVAIWLPQKGSHYASDEPCISFTIERHEANLIGFLMNESGDFYTDITCMYIRIIGSYSPKTAVILEEMLSTYGPHVACAGAAAVDYVRRHVIYTGSEPVKTRCLRFMDDYPQGVSLLEVALKNCVTDFRSAPG